MVESCACGKTLPGFGAQLPVRALMCHETLIATPARSFSAPSYLLQLDIVVVRYRLGFDASVQTKVGQPHPQGEKTGDIQNTEPDRDGQQRWIDLAERLVEAPQQLLSSMPASWGYRLHCHRASTPPAGALHGGYPMSRDTSFLQVINPAQ